MAYHIAHSDYSYGFRTLEAIRSIKDGARWDMSKCDPSLGEIPEWNENPEAYAALERVQETARELEKAYMEYLAVYERQELDPEEWELADRRRTA